MWHHFLMAHAVSITRYMEKIPSVVTAASAGAGVIFAFDQNALAAWSAAIVCSGGVVANWLVGKYKELREVRRQQDNADRAALVESIRDRIAVEIELASNVAKNSEELEGIKNEMDSWVREADARLKVIMKAMKEYEAIVKTKIEVCGVCDKLTVANHKSPGELEQKGA